MKGRYMKEDFSNLGKQKKLKQADKSLLKNQIEFQAALKRNLTKMIQKIRIKLSEVQIFPFLQISEQFYNKFIYLSKTMPGRNMTQQQQLKLFQICQNFINKKRKIDWKITAQTLSQITNSYFTRKQCQLKYLNYLSPEVGKFKTVPEYLQAEIFDKYSQGNSFLQIINAMKLRGMSQIVMKNFCKKQKQKICRGIADVYQIAEIKQNYRNFLVLFAKAPILQFYNEMNYSLTHLKQLINKYKYQKKCNKISKKTNKKNNNSKISQKSCKQKEFLSLLQNDQKNKIIQYLHQIIQLYKRADPKFKLKDQKAKNKYKWIQWHILGQTIEEKEQSPSKTFNQKYISQTTTFQFGYQLYNQQSEQYFAQKSQFNFPSMELDLDATFLQKLTFRRQQYSEYTEEMDFTFGIKKKTTQCYSDFQSD